MLYSTLYEVCKALASLYFMYKEMFEIVNSFQLNTGSGGEKSASVTHSGSIKPDKKWLQMDKTWVKNLPRGS